MSEHTTPPPRHSAVTADPSVTDNLTSELPLVDDETRAYEPERASLGRETGPIPARVRTSSWWTASTAVWAGLVLVAAGFTSIFYSWSEVAALLNVAQQLPYLVSGGLAGLALVIVGVSVIDVAVRRQDSRERQQQLAQINRVLAELHEALDTESHPDTQGPRP